MAADRPEGLKAFIVELSEQVTILYFGGLDQTLSLRSSGSWCDLGRGRLA